MNLEFHFSKYDIMFCFKTKIYITITFRVMCRESFYEFFCNFQKMELNKNIKIKLLFMKRFLI